MGTSYIEAGVFKGAHGASTRTVLFNLLLERNSGNKVVAAFTLDRRRPAHSPLLVPAEVLLTNDDLTFTSLRRAPLKLTLAMLADMIDHRLSLPYFREQTLDAVVNKTTLALFNTGIVDLASFLEDATRPSSQFLKRLPELRDFATEVRAQSNRWILPENTKLLLECLQNALYRSFLTNWPRRAPLSF